jgi:methylenetetrahydrofolate dehydrogenase (NADP+)/methenyltetrahydrofolate cyclohydrolase
MIRLEKVKDMIIDGRKIANKIETNLIKEVKKLKQVPVLVVILIGHNPASEIYVSKKQQACEQIGILCKIYRLPISTSQQKLLQLIEKLNKDKKVNGIIVQLPLPAKFDRNTIVYSIAPWKDVDGSNPINLGFLEIGQPLFIPPTAAAVLETVKYTKVQLKCLSVCLVGYSSLVSKPLVPLLIDLGATITICHKNTKNLIKHTKEADILVVAAGVPKLIKASMVKKGAIVIDVGINRQGKKIVGDVDFENVKKKAKFITPVPGGVGPITVVMLLRNLIQAARIYPVK